MRFVTRKCPHCNWTLESLTRHWIGLGDPRIKCPQCFGQILLDNVLEWDLRSKEDKFHLIFQYYVLGNLGAAAGIAMGIFFFAALVTALWGRSFNEVFGNSKNRLYLVAIWLPGALMSVVYRHRSFVKLVTESKLRTQDASYMETMREVQRLSYRGKVGL